jgi:hypothetical protein
MAEQDELMKPKGCLKIIASGILQLRCVNHLPHVGCAAAPKISVDLSDVPKTRTPISGLTMQR